jgi:hypothetical protein
MFIHQSSGNGWKCLRHTFLKPFPDDWLINSLQVFSLQAQARKNGASCVVDSSVGGMMILA